MAAIARLVLPGFLLCVGASSLYLSYATELSGDEQVYSDSAAYLSRAIAAVGRMEPVDPAALIQAIVRRGWFAPGMSALLTPAQSLFSGAAPVPALRAYVTLVNLGLLWLIARELLKLGIQRRYAYACIALPCVVPYYLFYLGMLWGDLIGTHLALLVLLHLERRIAQSEPGFVLGGRDAATIGLLLGATALVRPQYFSLLFLVVVRIALQKLRSREDASAYGGSWASVLKSTAWITLAATIVLAPWNHQLNRKFGPTFMVTTTYLDPLFRDEGYVRSAIEQIGRYRPVDPSDNFYAVHSKVAQDARAAGRSFSEQARLAAAKLPRRSLPERLRTVQESMRTFYLSESQFLKRFFRIQEDEAKFAGSLGQGLLGLNALLWYPILSLGLLAFCFPAFPQGNGYLLPLSIKGLVFALTMQPLLIGGHGRYYVALIPVLVLLVFLALRASPRAMSRELRKLSAHNSLVLVGQVFAGVYAAASVWMIAAS